MFRYRLVDSCKNGYYTLLDEYGRPTKYRGTDLRSRVARGEVQIEGYHLSGDRLIKNTDVVFLLMNRNECVARFNLERVLGVTGIMPRDFDMVFRWLDIRSKFDCVRSAKDFFNMIGINNYVDMIDVTHCVSLRDSYWVKRSGSKLNWDDVSPFRNDYSKLISTYALEGIFTGINDKNYFSPVIGTSGSFPHTWKFYGKNKITFIKAGSRYTLGGVNSGQEPFLEFFTSQLAEYLQFDHVDYRIRNHRRSDGKLDVVTECKCFTTESTGSVTAVVLGLTSYEAIIDYCKGLSDEAYNGVLNMLFLDCLVLNTDRHFSNIEFLVDNRTQVVRSLAPIYDNNYSLCPRHLPSDTFNRSDYIARDNRSFADLYKLVKKHKSFSKQLHSLRKFKFTAPDKVKMQEGRLDFLNWLIQEQARYLLSI